MNTDATTVAGLYAIIADKDSELIELKQKVEWLTQQLGLTQSRKFGISSETSEQFNLFNEVEAIVPEYILEPIIETVAVRRKKQKGKREIDFSGLPVEQIIHELPENERVCPDCCGEMHAFGHEVYRRELTCIPVQYKVTEHIQTAYACRACEHNSIHVPIKKSIVPVALIPGSGIVSPSLLSNVLNNKYTLALPLYRQEQEMARFGVNISRQTMSNWVITAHERWFNKLFNRLHSELLANDILHADETTLQVIHEDGRRASQKSYVWVYGTSSDSDRPMVLYDYQPSRAGECANKFLSGFSGMLHSDGYDAYHSKLSPEITSVGCWAHMRRKFTDTLKSIPKKLRKSSPANTGLDFCNQLFALEVNYTEQHLNYEERYFTRLKIQSRLLSHFLHGRKLNSTAILCQKLCLVLH